VVWILGAEPDLCEVDVGGIPIRRGESVLKKEQGRSPARGAGRNVNEERRVQSKLVLAAGSVKQLIESAIAGPDHGPRCDLIRYPYPRREVVLVGLDQATARK